VGDAGTLDSVEGELLIRKVAIFSAALLAASTLGMGAAAAKTPPATGAITCGTSGSVTLKPGIPATGTSTKKIKLQDKAATITACDASGVSGGKEAITGGVASIKATIPPGAACSTLLTATPSLSKPVLTVKLTGADGKAVAKITLKTLTFSQSGLGFALAGTVPDNAGHTKPFGGETLTAQINVDNLTDALACIGGTADLTHIDFSAAGGSTLSIA